MKEVVDRIVQYPNRYKLTDVSTGQDLGTYDFTEVPGTVQQEGTEINAELFESIGQDIENAGNFDPNGTYPDLTAGEATHAQSADNATTAKGDANGNDIAATYATKSELAAAGQFDPNGTYPNLTAGDAMHAASADAATKASQDAAGNNIQSTYATKAELNTKANQTALDGVINGTTPVARATAADSATNATNATKATNDAQGRNIASTYALKSEVGVRVYTHYITISAISGTVGSPNKKDCHATCMIEYKSTRSSKYTWDAFCQELYNQGIVGTNSSDDSILFKASGLFVKDSVDVIYEIIGICVYKNNRDYWITARQIQGRGTYYNLSIRESDGDVTEFIDIVV